MSWFSWHHVWCCFALIGWFTFQDRGTPKNYESPLGIETLDSQPIFLVEGVTRLCLAYFILRSHKVLLKHGWILSSQHSFFYFVIRSQRQETWNKRRQLFISTQFKRCHSFLSQWCHHSINYIPYRVLHFARTSPAFFNHRVEQVTWSQCENVNASEPFPQTFYVIIWSINQFLENYYLGSIFVVFTATRIMHDQF